MTKTFQYNDYKFLISVYLDHQTKEERGWGMEQGEERIFNGRVHLLSIRYCGRIQWEKEYANCSSDNVVEAIKDFEKQATAWVESRKNIDLLKEELQFMGFK